MIRIYPFEAVRPAPGRERDVASPPYDVVDRAEARDIIRANPHSFMGVVRADGALDDSIDAYDQRVYDAARQRFEDMQRDGLLRRDKRRRMFAYRQSATIAGVRHEQTGLVCCCDVRDYDEDRIRKHEKTRQAKEDDRTRHMLALNAHPGPVFLTYRDRDDVSAIIGRVTQGAPAADFEADDGVRHTVWDIDETDPLVRAFASMDFAYVADGHHRSASASRAARARRDKNPSHTGEEEYNRFLSVLFPASQLRILAYNRVVRDLHGLDASRFRGALESVCEVRAARSPEPAEPGRFCAYLAGEWLECVFPPSSIGRADPVASLDVSLLADRVLEPILGIRDVRTDPRVDFVGGIRGVRALEKLVNSGQFACAFSMHPTTIGQLLDVADAGLMMPPKSTWFEPKLRSGLLVHMLD